MSNFSMALHTLCIFYLLDFILIVLSLVRLHKVYIFIVILIKAKIINKIFKFCIVFFILISYKQKQEI